MLVLGVLSHKVSLAKAEEMKLLTLYRQESCVRWILILKLIKLLIARKGYEDSGFHETSFLLDISLRGELVLPFRSQRCDVCSGR
jgi:hypothetical protein